MLAKRRRRVRARRPRWSPSTRAPARSWRWSAAAPTTSRSSTAPSARAASRARSSSRSSTSRRSSRRPRQPHRPHAGDAACSTSPPPGRCADRRLGAAATTRTSTTATITLRRALALSRNIATIKVAEQIGFDKVAALWDRMGVGTATLRGYPSITLGVFELSPLEIADGLHDVRQQRHARVPLRAITARRRAASERITPTVAPPTKAVADPATRRSSSPT